MQNSSDWENEYLAGHPRNGFLTAAFLFFSLIACVTGALLIPSGLGFIAGYQQLQAQSHETAIVHFNRGLGYLAENYPELARTEFEVSLRFDSTFEPAQQKLREMQTNGNGTASTPQDRIAATLFNEARNFVSQKQWSDAIMRLEQLRTLKSDYRTTEMSDLLFQAYVGGGKAAVASGQIELARERFDAALTIRKNDPETLRQRDLAVLYLDGQQAVGYNWQTVIQKFSALYQQDPNYDDVKKRLFDAHAQYGDLAAKQGSPCLAAREYDSALTIVNDATLTQKRTQVMALCKQAISATPTPAAPTGAEEYISTKPTVADKPCNGTGEISGFVRDALGRLLAGVPVGYYADGVSLVTTKTDANGQYRFGLGKDPGWLRVAILGADGKTPSSLAADVQYPGGNNAGCHIVVDWQRVQ